MTKRNCSVHGCGRPLYGREYCNMHYQRMRKRGLLPTLTPDERFWAKVEKTDHCWEWTGSLVTSGYGNFRSRGRTWVAHRYAYVRMVGEIPPGMGLDHICFNRRCVNPDHLRLATQKQNMENLRGARRDNKTGVRGVFLHKPGRWRAQVAHHGRIIHVGLFDSVEDAGAAAQAKRNELFTHNNADRDAACLLG